MYYNNNQRIPQFIDRSRMQRSYIPWDPQITSKVNSTVPPGVYPRWQNGYVPIPAEWQERRVCIIGAGPVGLYTAFRFLQGNYFSDKTFEECFDDFNNSGRSGFGQSNNKQWKEQNSQCASLLRIVVMEKRGAILCGGASILSLHPSQLSESYKLLLSGRGVVDFPTLLKATKDNCDLPKKYWANRKQVFYITRENLLSFDPVIQFLLRSVSCGTSTIPHRWGFLKCIVDTSTGAIMGDEYPSTNEAYQDNRSSYDKAIGHQSPLHYVNNLPDAEKQGAGSLTIETGMLQIILIYAIKLLLYLQSADARTSNKSCTEIRGGRHRSCGNLIRERVGTVEKGHDDIQKSFDIFFNQDMFAEDRLLRTVQSGEFDMIFNASGKTALAPIEQFNVCTNHPGAKWPKQGDDKFTQWHNMKNILGPDMDTNNPNKFQNPTNERGSNPCKQWGSIMEINFGAGNNSSDEMFKNLITKWPGFNEGMDVPEMLANISSHGVENYFLNTNKQHKANYFGETNVEGLDLTADVGDLFEDHHDLRIFPSRGEGDRTQSGRLYIGVLIGEKENSALCRKYECRGLAATNTNAKVGMAGGPIQLEYTDDAQHADDLIINGIILKYAVLAQSRGVPYNSVDWLSAKFSWFPMILTKVQDGYAAQYQQPTTTSSTVLVQIGDAAYNAHYFSGMGVNNGFATVNWIFNRPESGSFRTSSTRGFYDRMAKFSKMYNEEIAQKSRAYVQKVRKEFGSPIIIPELRGIQNSTINDPNIFKQFAAALSEMVMPQSTFERESNERVQANFFGAEGLSPERAARKEVFANNNPQVQQLKLRNWLLLRLKKDPRYKGKTFFEIYLSLLKMFNYGLAAANANKPNQTDDDGDVNMLSSDDSDYSDEEEVDEDGDTTMGDNENATSNNNGDPQGTFAPNESLVDNFFRLQYRGKQGTHGYEDRQELIENIIQFNKQLEHQSNRSPRKFTTNDSDKRLLQEYERLYVAWRKERENDDLLQVGIFNRLQYRGKHGGLDDDDRQELVENIRQTNYQLEHQRNKSQREFTTNDSDEHLLHEYKRLHVAWRKEREYRVDELLPSEDLSDDDILGGGRKKKKGTKKKKRRRSIKRSRNKIKRKKKSRKYKKKTKKTKKKKYKVKK